MTARPVSVTAISWIQIVFIIIGAIGLLMTFLFFDNPMMQDAFAKNHAPVWVQLTMSSVSLVITLACAIGFLMRQNWARYVFVVWSVIGIVYTFVVTAISTWILIPGLILPVVTVVIVFLPNANRYFTGKDDPAPAPTEQS